jgi:hypothetical protein
MRLLIAALTVSLTLSLGGAAQASSSVQISSLECAKHPGGYLDIIQVKNVGDSPQDLSGWQLRSDPEASQRMELGVAGTLDSGEELFVVAGIHAVTIPTENQFRWSTSEILRDDDPNEYVRVLDGAGNQVAGMTCAGAPVDLSKPFPPPTQAPNAEPTIAPAVQAPAATPAPTVAPVNRPKTVAQPVVPASEVAPAAESDLPAGGGAPLGASENAQLAILAGLAAMIAGAGIIARGCRDGTSIRRRKI